MLQLLFSMNQDAFEPGVLESTLLTGVFKFLFILSALFYVVFAVIVIRQVQLMKNTLITSISPLLLIAAFIHLIIAVTVLILFIAIL